MNDFVGYFLHSDEGRAFLVRVPGVAQSALADAELAELMNWLLTRFSAAELPAAFVPYSADEVGRLRKQPEADPASARTGILERLAATLAPVRAAIETGDAG